MFHVYLKPRNGRWLVDSFMPAATFTPIGKAANVQAAADFMASPGESTTGLSGAGPMQINAVYAVVPFAVFGARPDRARRLGRVAKVRNRRLVGPP